MQTLKFGVFDMFLCTIVFFWSIGAILVDALQIPPVNVIRFNRN